MNLIDWLLEAAYPLWWARGADHLRGGYHESLHRSGQPTQESRRARLHPRQMWAFALARQLGWSGPHKRAVRHALDFFLAHYRREDLLYRTLVAPDGRPLNDDVRLYDQAFALLGFAAAYDTLREAGLRDLAGDLQHQLHSRFAHPLAGFKESTQRGLPLLSNSHMHLLEAALAWTELDAEAVWEDLAKHIVDLALGHFADPQHGFFREFFTEDWSAWPDENGRRVEPGHQFEWAWLLLRWAVRAHDSRARARALHLIELAEQYGVDRRRRVVINALRTDGTIVDAQARLWPQTERMKAACLAAHVTDEPHYSRIANEATCSLLRYLDTQVSGLWLDTMNADGSFIEQPVPASSFYHITTAIAELQKWSCCELSSKRMLRGMHASQDS